MATITKQDLLNQLATYTKDTLLKLTTYAELLLIPEEDLLINATMGDMLQKVFDLADVYFPQWTDRSHGDFGRFLAELFCLFSEKDFYYANLFANEGFLQTSTVYSNAYYKSVSLGRIPQLFTSAVCTVQVTFDAGAEVTLEPGEIVVTTQVGDALDFSNSERITIPQSGVPVTLLAKFANGKFQQKIEEFNGRSLRIFEGDIDTSSVEVYINNVQWSNEQSFSKLSPTDKGFIPLPESDASIDIVFGDNTFGHRPLVGDSITARFRVGGGTQGNIPVTPIAVSTAPIGRSVSSVVMVNDAVGGALQETIEEIKAKAPLAFRTQSKVVNPTDAIAILEEKPDIYQAFAYNWALNLYIYAIKSNGNIATQAEMDAYAADMQPITVMGYTVNGIVTSFIDLGPMELTVFVLAGNDLAEKEAEVRQLTLKYTNPNELAEYGRNFVFSDFADYLKSNISGVTNVDVDIVQGLPNASFAGGEVNINFSDITQTIDSTGTSTITTNPAIVVPNIVVEQGDLKITIRNAS